MLDPRIYSPEEAMRRWHKVRLQVRSPQPRSLELLPQGWQQFQDLRCQSLALVSRKRRQVLDPRMRSLALVLKRCRQVLDERIQSHTR